MSFIHVVMCFRLQLLGCRNRFPTFARCQLTSLLWKHFPHEVFALGFFCFLLDCVEELSQTIFHCGLRSEDSTAPMDVTFSVLPIGIPFLREHCDEWHLFHGRGFVIECQEFVHRLVDRFVQWPHDVKAISEDRSDSQDQGNRLCSVAETQFLRT